MPWEHPLKRVANSETRAGGNRVAAASAPEG